MKKAGILLLVLIMLVAVVGCGNNSIGIIGGADGPTDILVSTNKLFKKTTDFVYSDGVDEWKTEVKIKPNGSFKGQYNNTDLGAVGEGYPKGTTNICEFKGNFGEFVKTDETVYKISLQNMQLTTKAEQWIEDDVLFVPSKPVGLEEGEEFTLYLPGTPKSYLPETIKNSWQLQDYMEKSGQDAEIPCYILYNLTTDSAFFEN